jgi:hypothetical protein
VGKHSFKLYSSLVFGLITVNSASSFGVEVKKNSETSCGSKARPVYFHSSGSGLEDVQMGLLDGEFGPEFQINGVRIVFIPGSNTDQNKGPGKEKQGYFGVINGPKPSQGVKKGQIDHSYFYDGQEAKSAKGGGGTARILLTEVRDGQGNIINQYLTVQGPETKQQMRINIQNNSKGDKNVDIKMTVETRLTDGGGACGLAGIMETHMTGQRSQSSGGTDPNASVRLRGCKNTQEGTDHSQAKGGEQQNTVDATGNRYVMMKDKSPNNQFSCSDDVVKNSSEASGQRGSGITSGANLAQAQR